LVPRHPVSRQVAGITRSQSCLIGDDDDDDDDDNDDCDCGGSARTGWWDSPQAGWWVVVFLGCLLAATPSLAETRSEAINASVTNHMAYVHSGPLTCLHRETLQTLLGNDRLGYTRTDVEQIDFMSGRKTVDSFCGCCGKKTLIFWL